MAAATIGETVEQQAGVYDLSRFLATLSLFENPEVVFGTEQPWFVSFSNLENKHIRILEQLSDQEKLGLNNIIYSMKREGTNSSGNRRQKTSDCRVVNNGRFTYILDRYNYIENLGL